MEKIRILVIGILTAVLLGCSSLLSPPEITSLTADPAQIFTDEKTLLSCEATAPYGQQLEYTWSCSEGILPEIKIGETITWIAPSIPGVYTIQVQVSDGGFSTIDDAIDVDVIENNIAYFSFTDSRDGKSYRYINYEGQAWMAENLAFLPQVSRPEEGADDSPYYYVYDYQGNNVSSAQQLATYQTYGVLYNWKAASTACPGGWHLPTDNEWKILEKNIGMSAADADDINWRASGEVAYYLKSKTGWFNNGNGVNRIGFGALPGGYRYGGESFKFIEDKAFFWTSSTSAEDKAWARYFYYQHTGVYRYTENYKRGFSVRCVKD